MPVGLCCFSQSLSLSYILLFPAESALNSKYNNSHKLMSNQLTDFLIVLTVANTQQYI